MSQLSRRITALAVTTALLCPSAALHAQNAAPAPAPAPAAVARNDDTVSLNFVNADLLAVIKAVSEITGRNILIDPRVSGTVNIVTPKPVPRSLVWGILLSALRAQGFTAVGDGNGVTRIVPEAEAKFFNELGGRANGDRIVTEVFILENERAQQLVPVLRPLMSPNNVINAAPASNALIITDYAENIARIRRILAELDRPTGGDIVAIPLKHTAAADFMQIVQRLAPDATVAGAPGMPPRLAVATDARTNSILVRADNPTLANRIRALASTLDTPTSQLGNIHVVYLRNADATRMADTLRALLGGQGGASGGPGTQQNQLPGQYGVQQAGGIFGNALAGQQGMPGMPGAQGAPGTTGTMSQVSLGPLATLPPVMGGGQVGGVTIQAYPEQNSLVIIAPDPLYNALRSVIDKLDARRAQIYVEALIVEVTATKAAEFGVQWQDLGGINRPGTNFIGSQNFTNGLGGASTTINGLAQALPLLPGGLALGAVRGTLTIAGKQVANLQVLARALETDAEANILSTPNLVTLDNEEARIIVGQNIPITTGSFTLTGAGSGVTNPFQTFTRQDIGVALRVKPVVAEAGAVRLDIYQEVSSIFDQNNPNGIILNKRALESQVVVDDGQIIVLGGLIGDNVNSSVQQVPVLGKIPGIGWLFRYSTRQREKTNLMVFLRPLVMRDAQAAESITGDRYDYIRDVQASQTLRPSLVLPNMPPPELPPLDRSPRPAQPLMFDFRNRSGAQGNPPLPGDVAPAPSPVYPDGNRYAPPAPAIPQ
jgi:general secretion pathway protein D